MHKFLVVFLVLLWGQHHGASAPGPGVPGTLHRVLEQLPQQVSKPASSTDFCVSRRQGALVLAVVRGKRAFLQGCPQQEGAGSISPVHPCSWAVWCPVNLCWHGCGVQSSAAMLAAHEQHLFLCGFRQMKFPVVNLGFKPLALEQCLSISKARSCISFLPFCLSSFHL